MKPELMDRVLKQITEDIPHYCNVDFVVMNGDMTPIKELIAGIPDETVQSFLHEPEGD